MKRKIYNRLQEWKNQSNGTSAVLIEGARRIGKSYIVEKNITSRHNISPIEVKSGKRFTLNSLQKCINRFGNALSTPYVIYDGDLKVDGAVVYVPYYMTPLL